MTQAFTQGEPDLENHPIRLCHYQKLYHYYIQTLQQEVKFQLQHFH